jgi:hypothetical protein
MGFLSNLSVNGIPIRTADSLLRPNDQTTHKKLMIGRMAGVNDLLFTLLGLAIASVVLFFVCWLRRRPRAGSGKSVRRAVLSTLPIITVTANHILLDSYLRMDKVTRLALELLAKRACVFLIIAVTDELEVNSIRANITSQFAGLIPADRILYSQASLGRVLMSRQLEAVAHIDFDPEVIHEASLSLKTVLIAPSDVISTRANWSSANFKDFVTNGNTDFFDLLSN